MTVLRKFYLPPRPPLFHASNEHLIIVNGTFPTYVSYIVQTSMSDKIHYSMRRIDYFYIEMYLIEVKKLRKSMTFKYNQIFYAISIFLSIILLIDLSLLPFWNILYQMLLMLNQISKESFLEDT